MDFTSLTEERQNGMVISKIIHIPISQRMHIQNANTHFIFIELHLATKEVNSIPEHTIIINFYKYC